MDISISVTGKPKIVRLVESESADGSVYAVIEGGVEHPKLIWVSNDRYSSSRERLSKAIAKTIEILEAETSAQV